MKSRLENREVIIEKVEHGEDFCDSYITLAYYADTGEELTADELDQLTEECASMLYDEWEEKKAEYSFESYKSFSKYGE
jgi:NAD dependent epimerase/dehydratase family enzyme